LVDWDQSSLVEREIRVFTLLIESAQFPW
jgi:hypothetical protein